MILPLQGVLDGFVHRYPIRVYYEDTDAGGIVYHANYLRFAERARTEMLRCIGAVHADMIETHGAMIVVRGLEIDFIRPARLDDVLEVRTQLLQLGGASIKMSQLIAVLGRDNADGIHARIHLRLACVTVQGRPARLPEDFSQKAAAMIERDRV